MLKHTLSYVFERLVLCLGLFLFFVGAYFGSALWNAGRSMPVIEWDPVFGFPFWPPAIIVYLSAYLAPLTVAMLLTDRRKLIRFLGYCLVLVVVCLGGFMVRPLTILRPQIVGPGLFDAILAWFYSIDPPTNLFPSLHVSMAFFCAGVLSLARPRYRILVYAWAVAVALSTLLTRQHYLIDVAAGLALGLIAVLLYKKSK